MPPPPHQEGTGFRWQIHGHCCLTGQTAPHRRCVALGVFRSWAFRCGPPSI